MPNYVLDKAYKVETSGGLSSCVVVVKGDYDGGCKLPAGENDSGILGVTINSATQNHFITVRKNGIAGIISAGAISRGDAVCVADNTGKIKSAGKASAVTGVVGNNNAIRWTSKVPGILGNTIVVDIVVSGNNTPLSISVSGNTVTINSATDGSGNATTTASQAITAISSNSSASKIISGANEGASNGTGVIADETKTLSGGELGSNIIGYAEESASAQGDIIDVFLSL